MSVPARGLTFEVTAGGPENGPAVLLLHGFPQHSGEWDLVVPALWTAGLRTYALDQRGYSPGARPGDVADYTMAESVADALAVLDTLGVDRAHVVGHDWGAAVGWRLAAQHPDRLHTLTAVSVPHPAALVAALASDADQQSRSAYIQLFQQPGTAEAALLEAEGALLRWLMRGVPAGRVESYVAPMRAPGALTAALNWYRALELGGGSFGGVGPVTVPTTFVWSDGDTALGRTAAEGSGGFVTADYRFVELAGISHWVPDEAPDQTAAAILDRITRQKPAS